MLRLGTRGSQLALWQARTVAARLAHAGGPACEITVIKTSGDRLQEAPLSEIGGKRLFVKEIEDALLKGEIDLAVHSSKDMTAILPDGLVIAGVLPREDPLDAVVLPLVRLKPDATCVAEVVSGFSRTPATIEELITALGQAPSIGTGSVRRIAQITRLMPGARFSPIRGNLDTRLRKLDAGDHDALVLAAAGLRRLGFLERISFTLSAAACVPAPGQGIVAIQTRDNHVRGIIESMDDEASLAARDALTAERALVEALGGGCQTPIGALASPAAGDTIELVAVVIALDGSRVVRGHGQAARSGAAALGAAVGAQLITDGAGDILAEAQRISS